MSNGIKCENWNIENWKFKELNGNRNFEEDRILNKWMSE